MDYQKTFYGILIFLFIFFISVYGASKSGYYEYQNKKQAIVTEENIKKFESDLAKGKRVDIKDYLTEDYVSYDNKITQIGDKMSDFLIKGISKSLEGTFKIVEKIVK